MIYAFGACTLDTDRYELRRAGMVCPLEPHALDILTYLLQHRDRVVTKHELLEQLWPNRFVGEGILAQRLMTIRKAIGDSGQTSALHQTVHGRGYRFAAEVAVHADARRVVVFSPTTSSQTRGQRVVLPCASLSPCNCACAPQALVFRETLARPGRAGRDLRFSAARRTSSGATPSSPSSCSGGAERSRACDKSGSSSGNLGLARRRWSMRSSRRSRPRKTSPSGAANAWMTMGWANPIFLCWRRWDACAGTRREIALCPVCASMPRAGSHTCPRCSSRPTGPHPYAR